MYAIEAALLPFLNETGNGWGIVQGIYNIYCLIYCTCSPTSFLQPWFSVWDNSSTVNESVSEEFSETETVSLAVTVP